MFQWVRKDLEFQLISFENTYSNFSGEITSDLLKAGNDIRHTVFGAFNPTQNVTNKLRSSLERVSNLKSHSKG